MDEKSRMEIALFKFGLIGAAVNKTFSQESLMAFFRDVSSKRHKLPDGKEVQYATMTLKKWYQTYKNQGIEGLKPRIRSDAGVSRSLSDDIIFKIHDIKNKFPHITGTLVYQKLIEEGLLKRSNASLSTVLRFIKENNLKASQLSPQEIKAFEMESSNDCWQADSSTGPRITIDGIKVTTYMIAIIDDASRLITHIEIFKNDNSLNVQKVFKKAVTKYGVPKKFYTDNGGPYVNQQLKYICASIGTVLIHHPPYAAFKKGKIERFFRTVKDRWMHGLDWNNFNNLDDLNDSLNKFLDDNYLNTIHSSLENTPRKRYLVDYEKIKYLPDEEIEKCFHHRISRKVNKDSTIRVLNSSYEVPQKYIGQKIELRYNPLDIKEAYIIDGKNNCKDTIQLLNRVENSNMVRKAIDYSKYLEGGNIK